jgi:predicted dehydrogenase
MALDMNQEEKTLGMENFARVANDLTRRGFMKSLVISGSAVAVAGTAAYFGYQSIQGNPVKAALIGGGDEGGVLVGEHNPEFLEFVAVCDIRPSNMKRIFEGQGKTHIRKGFKVKYGEEAEKKIKKYDDYARMLRENTDIEAVVIALPLHLHAPVAVEAMRIGKERGKPIHVLCEKLMAWNIAQCKKMIRVAKETNSILSIGHQRHYSMLYAHATEVIKAGVLGDIRHIRALWHRNNTWEEESAAGGQVPGTDRYYRDGWYPPVPVEDYEHLKDTVKQYGYDSVEQLVRWRLYNETGGGLMAELGSHQLDACSIFLGKVHPIAVSGYGGKPSTGPGRTTASATTTSSPPMSSPGPITRRTRTTSLSSPTARSTPTPSRTTASASWARAAPWWSRRNRRSCSTSSPTPGRSNPGLAP